MKLQTCKLLIDTNKQELEKHGTLLFPCARYYTDLEKLITHDIPWHWHEELELIFVKNGSLKIRINNTSYLLHKNEGIFINSNILHTISMYNNAYCQLDSLVFHPNLMSGFGINVFEQRYITPLITCKQLLGIPLYLNNKWHLQILQCLNEAFTFFDLNELGYELLVREKLSHILYLIIVNSIALLETSSKEKNHDATRVKEMLNYIHVHYAEKISITQLASYANISERECLRCFQKNLGISPIQYLLKYRISVATQLLSDMNMSIAMICNNAGFDSPSYFSKTFKRFTGCTPTSYRIKSLQSD